MEREKWRVGQGPAARRERREGEKKSKMKIENRVRRSTAAVWPSPNSRCARVHTFFESLSVAVIGGKKNAWRK
jgi:hypothetical protein